MSEQGWMPIETVADEEEIIGVWRWGSRWNAGHLTHDPAGFWVDVHSDRIVRPVWWMPLPPPAAPKETKP